MQSRSFTVTSWEGAATVVESITWPGSVSFGYGLTYNSEYVYAYKDGLNEGQGYRVYRVVDATTLALMAVINIVAKEVNHGLAVQPEAAEEL